MCRQSIIGTRDQYISGMVIEYEKSVARARVCAITHPKGLLYLAITCSLVWCKYQVLMSFLD